MPRREPMGSIASRRPVARPHAPASCIALICATALVAGNLIAAGPTRAFEPGLAGSVTGDELADVLAGDVALVLDVRAVGDCDETPALRRATVSEPFDSRPPGTAEAEMATEDFLARVATSKAMAAALAAKRPVLVVCCIGLKSALVADMLAKRGYYALYLVEGLVNPKLPPQLVQDQ